MQPEPRPYIEQRPRPRLRRSMRRAMRPRAARKLKTRAWRAGLLLSTRSPDHGGDAAEVADSSARRRSRPGIQGLLMDKSNDSVARGESRAGGSKRNMGTR